MVSREINMKVLKTIGLVIAAIAVVAVVGFMLVGHADEQVSGVALADTQISDLETLDAINSSKGVKLGEFQGTLYSTSCVEYGKYAQTSVAAIPQRNALYANVLFIASPKDMQYKAVWSYDGQTIKEETRAITATDNREAVSYMLDNSLVQKGEYTLAIYYADKQLYSQKFTIG